MKQHRPLAQESVLVLGDHLERRVVLAARRLGLEPAEFIVTSVERRCAKILDAEPPAANGALNRKAEGEIGPASMFEVRWAIRPSETRVLRIVEQLTHVPTERLVEQRKASATAEARSVAAYLLTHDAGLSLLDAGRILQRTSPIVARLSASVEHVIGTPDPRAELVEGARRLFRNGITSGKPYPPSSQADATGDQLTGLRARRLSAQVTQRDLAARSGIARETLSRLESLKRRAHPETVSALARALNVAPGCLTDSDADVPAVLWRPPSESPGGGEKTHRDERAIRIC